jgi:RNA polymerase-interacting CarD/CdnL/TRCF family regulator
VTATDPIESASTASKAIESLMRTSRATMLATSRGSTFLRARRVDRSVPAVYGAGAMANKASEIPIGDGSLHIGDRVVYPNQGICRITGVEVKQIAGRNWEVVTLSREEDGATVMVPREKVMGIGLRKVASTAAIDDLFDQLAEPGDDPELDWKVRHRENADRMTGGGLQGTLDVLKGLHALSKIRPLPQKERELYDNARHLLVGEIAAAVNLPLHVAEENLDYALWPPAGMKRKGKPLQPATLSVPGAVTGVRLARASDEEGDEDLGAEEEETAAESAEETADAEESDIADRSKTQDVVRQRAMRVAAEEEKPEPLDELAEDALEATHEDEAARASRKLHAPPGTTRPQSKQPEQRAAKAKPSAKAHKAAPKAKAKPAAKKAPARKPAAAKKPAGKKAPPRKAKR